MSSIFFKLPQKFQFKSILTRFSSTYSYKDTVLRGQKHLYNPKYEKYSYAISETGNLHLLCDTIGDRINTLAEKYPNDTCYKFSLTQSNLSFKEIKQRTDEIAQNLLSKGFKKGDRMAVLLPNIPELALTILACSSIGVIVVLMNPAYQLVEIEYMLKKTQSKGLVILDNLKTLKHYETLKKIAPELENSVQGELNSKNLPDLKHVILVKNRLMSDNSEQYKGTWGFDRDISMFNQSSQKLPTVDFDDSFVMLFTVILILI